MVESSFFIMYAESDLERAKQGKMMKRMQERRMGMRRVPRMVLRVW